MMKLLVAVVLALGLAACGGRGETVGTVGGAALGGAVGSSVTGGSTLGTLGGAAVGGYVGNKAGEDYDRRHPR
jgi:osmotically inducible lipoprotein OsmB